MASGRAERLPRALFLCSGTGSVGKPFRDSGYEVVDVDRDGKHAPDIQTDITTWDYKAAYPQGHWDVIWASPDCTQYSRARTTAKTPRDLQGADRLVAKCREIIEYFGPRLWFIENPDSSLLKHRSVVAGLPFVRVDYCMYSGCPYRKRTRIWTNAQWTPKLCDRSHLVDGKHAMTAQRGPCKGHGAHDKCTLDQLHRLPAELCREIHNVALQQTGREGEDNVSL